MTVELMRLRSPPQPCSYLPEQTASLDYRIVLAMDAVRRGTATSGLFRGETFERGYSIFSSTRKLPVITTSSNEPEANASR